MGHCHGRKHLSEGFSVFPNALEAGDEGRIGEKKERKGMMGW
jgi:hypothetical protein